jgi:hypothetical protein
MEPSSHCAGMDELSLFAVSKSTALNKGLSDQGITERFVNLTCEQFKQESA